MNLPLFFLSLKVDKLRNCAICCEKICDNSIINHIWWQKRLALHDPPCPVLSHAYFPCLEEMMQRALVLLMIRPYPTSLPSRALFKKKKKILVYQCFMKNDIKCFFFIKWMSHETVFKACALKCRDAFSITC